MRTQFKLWWAFTVLMLVCAGVLAMREDLLFLGAIVLSAVGFVKLGEL